MRSLLVAVILLGICTYANPVTAGLIHHKITVRNDTAGTAKIALYTADGDMHEAIINSKSTHIFNIGAKCAKFLKGGMSTPYAYGETAIDPKYPYYCVRNDRSSAAPTACILSCSSSSHKIILFTDYNGLSTYIFDND